MLEHWFKIDFTMSLQWFYNDGTMTVQWRNNDGTIVVHSCGVVHNMSNYEGMKITNNFENACLNCFLEKTSTIFHFCLWIYDLAKKCLIS